MVERRSSRAISFAIGCLLLGGCSVGPDYVRPTAPSTPGFKEAQGAWKRAEPRDEISKGDWYKIFKDERLDALEEQAMQGSLTLRAAIARVSESRAVARQAEADFYPSLNFSASGERQRTSPNNGSSVAQSSSSNFSPETHTFNSATVVPFDLSYEVDIWGRIRRAFEAAGNNAQATVADYLNVVLGLKADVATNYFALCAYDSQIDVERRTINARQENLKLTNSRFTGGIGTQLDVEQAKAELASTQAQLSSLRGSRAQVEHALAILVGQPPAAFSLPFQQLKTEVPLIPPGLPSDLLERRPDIAAAERRVAAQNAQIGVAVGAYFPVVRLTGQTGLDSGDLGLLFNWESRIWSYGPSITFPIFDGGRIEANIKQQRAVYEENVANYRQQVLVAFQEVEDSLSSLRYLAQQQEAEQRALQAYRSALDLTNSRYTSGLVSYFDVITAERSALDAEQLTVQIAGNRIASTVRLVKALGGGWADASLRLPALREHVASPSTEPSVLTQATPAGRPGTP